MWYRVLVVQIVLQNLSSDETDDGDVPMCLVACVIFHTSDGMSGLMRAVGGSASILNGCGCVTVSGKCDHQGDDGWCFRSGLLVPRKGASQRSRSSRTTRRLWHSEGLRLPSLPVVRHHSPVPYSTPKTQFNVQDQQAPPRPTGTLPPLSTSSKRETNQGIAFTHSDANFDPVRWKLELIILQASACSDG